MTDVAFHFNAPDCVFYACRLLRKAVGRGAKLVVIGLPETLARLNVTLWTFSAIDFVPHCEVNSSPEVLLASPVILAPSVESVPHQSVLLNLGPQVPHGFERFARVIELVGRDDEDRQFGRKRWKHYIEHGCVPATYDLAAEALP